IIYLLQDFTGNTDRNTVVLNVLHPSIDARYIRVNPKTWNSHISMRMELLGCPSGTNISVFIFFSKKLTGFHLIYKSAKLSPRTLIQLQFGLNGLGQFKEPNMQSI
ncbi:unnamed protein product, partial [Porites lobata]